MRLSPDPDRASSLRWAARRRGVPAAEIIREGVHLAALACRQWDEPFFEEVLDLGGRWQPPGRPAEPLRDRVTPGRASDTAVRLLRDDMVAPVSRSDRSATREERHVALAGSRATSMLRRWLAAAVRGTIVGRYRAG